MKPLRIEITNLGAITHTEIDLTGVDIAVICGPNGAGKSTAFTVAPMFALFGSTKGGTSADDMVRTGATEAAVTFDFEHAGDIYRVIRTRSKKGKGKTTLELQRLSGELWTSESGASISETQKKIISLLNLDEETFSSSSMILQGQSNAFTSRPAGQRKAILAQILQLDQYETLQEKARTKVSETNIALEKIKTKIDEIDLRSCGKTTLESEKLDIEIQLTSLERELKTMEADLQTAQVEYNILEARIQQAEEISKQASSFLMEVQQKTIERDRHQQRRQNAEKILVQESTILANVAGYEKIKEKVTVLRTKKEQQNQIFAEASRLKDELTGVETNLATVVKRMEEINHLLADRPRLEKAAADYQEASMQLAESIKKQDSHNELTRHLVYTVNQLTLSVNKFNEQKRLLRREIEMLQGKTALLKNAQCIDINNAQCAFLADAQKAKLDAERLGSQYSALENPEEIEFNQEIARTEALIDECGFDLDEHARLQDLIVEVKPLAEKFTTLNGAIALLDNLTSQKVDLDTRSTDLNVRLQSMRQQYKDLSEGLKELPLLEFQLIDLSPWLQSKEQLPAAKEIVSTTAPIIEHLEIEIETARVQGEKLQLEYQAIIGDSAGLKTEAALKVMMAQETIKKRRDEQTYLVGKLGGLQAKLAILAEDEKTRLSLTAEMDPLSKELVRWQTLVKAFGRDGIPALIIENAVPELERIANDILSQMTGGKNFLRFETQRELKSRSGMAETLDIIVGDWAGERIYETFSGGEQLRIDFAIRFALAELLAHRAGSKVEWLTIDEGWGSQSEEFLPLVIDAVKSIASRFGVVIVISHVRAVQEAFENQIYFRPADEAADVA